MGDTQLSAKPLHALPGPGSELGQYRIIELLGVGGMGQVFLAEHKRLGRRVALKLLLPQFAANPDIIARFFHEAKAVNQINHAHIVEIMDFVEDPNGYNYFIMELLDGHDLATTREQEGPFTLARTIGIARQIASALSATHAHGIVHRDLKPENIFLINRDGQQDFVKILDFGIAKLAATDGDERPKTRAGMILGTPEYMSPEQAGGKSIDARSDLYSLGIILYWMLSDETPFRGDSMGEILVKQLTEPPPPLSPTSASGERIPTPLARSVDELLRRDPEKRPPSANTLIERLSVLGGAPDRSLPSLAPIQYRRGARTKLIAAVAIAAVLAGSAFGFWKLRAAGLNGGPTEAVPPTAAAVVPPALPPLPEPKEVAAKPGPPTTPAPGAAALPAEQPRAKAEPPKALSHPKAKAKKKAANSGDNTGMIDPFAP